MNEPAKIKVSVKESHRYGDLLVHDGIEFDVKENEFVCVVGQSGCGKSTCWTSSPA